MYEATEDILSDLEVPLVLASKTKRFVAILIDYVIYFSFFFFMCRTFGESYATETGDSGWKLTGWPALLLFASWFVMPAIEGATGQSLGKLIFRLEVVHQEGWKASVGQGIVRHLFDLVDFFPFFGLLGVLVASRNSQRQRVGDLVAKTIVVEK